LTRKALRKAAQERIVARRFCKFKRKALPLFTGCYCVLREIYDTIDEAITENGLDTGGFSVAEHKRYKKRKGVAQYCRSPF